MAAIRGVIWAPTIESRVTVNDSLAVAAKRSTRSACSARFATSRCASRSASRRAFERPAANIANENTAMLPMSAPAYATVSFERIVAMRAPVSPLHDVPHTSHRRDQLSIVLRIDLLAEVIDHHVHDVGAWVEVIPPSILGDQCPAHHAALMAHEVLEHGVFLRRQLDELSAAVDLVRVPIELQVGHPEAG